MAAKVEHIVINTDRARLARLKKAITFEAVPPGQQLTRINPTARSFSKSKPFVLIQSHIIVLKQMLVHITVCCS